MYTGDLNRSFPFWGEIGPFLSPGFLSLAFLAPRKSSFEKRRLTMESQEMLGHEFVGATFGKGVRWMDELILRVEQNDDDDDDDDSCC